MNAGATIKDTFIPMPTGTNVIYFTFDKSVFFDYASGCPIKMFEFKYTG